MLVFLRTVWLILNEMLWIFKWKSRNMMVNIHALAIHHTRFRSLKEKKIFVVYLATFQWKLLLFTCIVIIDVPFISVLIKLIVSSPEKICEWFDLIVFFSSRNFYWGILHTCHTKNNIALVDFNILRVRVCVRAVIIWENVCAICEWMNERASECIMPLFLSLLFNILMCV